MHKNANVTLTLIQVLFVIRFEDLKINQHALTAGDVHLDFFAFSNKTYI